MGANAVKAPSAYGRSFFWVDSKSFNLIDAISENLPQLHEPGYPLWMTREEYITFGGQQLAACDTGIREG